MKSPMEIVAASMADAPAITLVLDDAARYKVSQGDLAWGTSGPSEQSVREAISSGQVYAVSLGGELVGTARLQWVDETFWGKQSSAAGYVHQLAIASSARGKGLGAKVLDWMATRCRSEGRPYVRLDCDARNPRLCRYYYQLDFTQVGEKRFPAGYVAALFERRT